MQNSWKINDAKNMTWLVEIKNETHEDVKQLANIFKRYDLDTEKAE